MKSGGAVGALAVGSSAVTAVEVVEARRNGELVSTMQLY